MELEIRDVQSQASHLISEKGAVLGRQGGGGDVPVPERTVSGKHCRIFIKDGKWFIEDLRSSNGTFVNGTRINAPTPLAVGAKFTLCRYAYEVTRLLGEEKTGATAMLEDAALVAGGEVLSDTRTRPIDRSGSGRSAPEFAGPTLRSPASALRDANRGSGPKEISGPTNVREISGPAGAARELSGPVGLGREASGPKSSPRETSGRGSAPREVSGSGSAPRDPAVKSQPPARYSVPTGDGMLIPEPSASGVDEAATALAGLTGTSGSWLEGLSTALPRAAAYYLTAIPGLLANPIAAVQGGIGAPRFGAFAAGELIGYALPPYLVALVLPALAAIVSAAIRGGMASALVVALLINLGVAVVAALLVGVLWHPLLTWWVALLKGQSDQVSRTNMAVMVFAAVGIMGIAGAAGVALSAIPVPFVGILAPIVSAVGLLIVFYVQYSWFRHFEVMKWFPLVLLVLGALACVPPILAAVAIVRADIATMRGHGGTSTVALADAAAAARALDEQAREADKGAAGEIAELARKAEQAAAATAATGTPGGGAASSPAGGSVGAAPGATPAPSPSGTLGSTTAVPSAGGSSPAATGTGSTPRTPPTAYQEFVRKRDAIEAAIDADPTLLKQKGVLPVYQELLKITAKIKSRCGGKAKSGKRGGADKMDKRIADKLCDAEVFEATGTVVDHLYRLVVERH